MVVRGAAFRSAYHHGPIDCATGKCQLLHDDVAPFVSWTGSGDFADQALVGEIFAGCRDALTLQFRLK